MTPSPTSAAIPSQLLGPFLGIVTENTIKIWLHLEGEHSVVYVTLHEGKVDAPAGPTTELNLLAENLYTDCVTVGGLKSNTRYFYKLWTDEARTIPLPLEGLEERELRFWTLSNDPNDQIDFVVMSCHNPTVSGADGYEGHAVWADLPQIIARASNEKVRLALLVGDQMYADDWEKKVLAEQNEPKRLAHYVEAYRKYWGNIHYRRVMCSLPAVMMWDDHDITDGWGSRTAQFVSATSSKFKPEWNNLFDAAFKSFAVMQASRNPQILAEDPKDGLDFCFRIGKWGFAFLDLRTNRNLRLNRLHTDEQFDRVTKWVRENQKGIHTLFVISPVVFSHGSPVVEDMTLSAWPWVMRFVAWLANLGKWGKGVQTRFDKSLGDISDDIKDSWGSEENAEQTDRLLDFLFDIQNAPLDERVGVVILSGDIHTSGYANIYSADQSHAGRSSIAHITSSSIAYTPFNWLLEAIYRYASKAVALGKRGVYSSQISHHFCSRSVAVLSIRPTVAGDYQLKVKYYLEGFPEPQILAFDLNKISHRENISWVAQSKLSEKKFAPTANIDVDVDALLALRAREGSQKLNYTESIVDLMKLLGMDSSIGARKRVAQSLGYEGTLNGSPEMNIFLLEKMKELIRKNGGNVPKDL